MVSGESECLTWQRDMEVRRRAGYVGWLQVSVDGWMGGWGVPLAIATAAASVGCCEVCLLVSSSPRTSII
jgi:hypothetical protein